MFCNWLPFVLCSRDGTGVQPYKPPLPSASTPPAVWSGLHWLGMAGPGLADPASPVPRLESPSGRSAVPQTVLRL
ncbi:hypothetical protein YC2023_025199 [Brassica napus]